MKPERKRLLILLMKIGLLALMARVLGGAIPIIGGPIIGIVAGILLAKHFQKSDSQFHLKHISKYFLQYSIILIGFELDIHNVLQVGSSSMLLMFLTVTFTISIALLCGRFFKLPLNTILLIGVGTAICGGSAIAATASVIRANDDEIIHSLSTIFLFNIAAAFIFPVLGHIFLMSDHRFGAWAGTAINDSSSVMAAGFTYSDVAGQFATIVKLTRTLMIIPITFIISIVYSGKQSQNNYSMKKIFPWFILGFVLASSIRSLCGFIPVNVFNSAVLVGKYFMIIAMIAIGLNTDILKLLRNGRKPILLGTICWAMLSVMSFCLLNVFNM